LFWSDALFGSTVPESFAGCASFVSSGFAWSDFDSANFETIFEVRNGVPPDFSVFVLGSGILEVSVFALFAAVGSGMSEVSAFAFSAPGRRLALGFRGNFVVSDVSPEGRIGGFILRGDFAFSRISSIHPGLNGGLGFRGVDGEMACLLGSEEERGGGVGARRGTAKGDSDLSGVLSGEGRGAVVGESEPGCGGNGRF
jgi:hypothetical protein